VSAETTHIKTAIHGQVYRWASQYVAGKSVLDVGCGDGQGAIVLAEKAERVVAIDSDPVQIAAARGLAAPANVSFQVMSCEEMDFGDHSFDVVINNALLEYLPDVSAFLAEGLRVLKEDGTFICGTKNLERSLKRPDGAPLYENHLREYNRQTLAALLSPLFESTNICGENMKPRAASYIMDSRALGLERTLVKWRVKHWVPAKWRKAVRAMMTGVKLEGITADDFYVAEQATAEALYLLAVAQGPIAQGQRVDTHSGAQAQRR
jgi:2-polyprenyl-3-methyl-5-hydroxy-6-metoxy-1,4-benzoquinol methylase